MKTVINALDKHLKLSSSFTTEDLIGTNQNALSWIDTALQLLFLIQFDSVPIVKKKQYYDCLLTLSIHFTILIGIRLDIIILSPNLLTKNRRKIAKRMYTRLKNIEIDVYESIKNAINKLN